MWVRCSKKINYKQNHTKLNSQERLKNNQTNESTKLRFTYLKIKV